MIRKKFLYWRYRPIHVFCFHQTSAEFDASTMWECDWTEIELFKRNIQKLKSEYTFISLPEAYEKLKNDTFRIKKYAVLTSDDGWASLKEIVPWLMQERVPLTLFVNPCYLDGEHYQERESERLLTKEDLLVWSEQYDGCLNVGSHGWVHRDATKMSEQEFLESVRNSEKYLRSLSGKIPYYAFTYGRYSKKYVDVLNEEGLIPVFIDGKVNYNKTDGIHRECLDGKEL